jgi:hypothetical protein
MAHTSCQDEANSPGRPGRRYLAFAEVPRYRAAHDATLAVAALFFAYWQQHPEYHQVSQGHDLI